MNDSTPIPPLKPAISSSETIAEDIATNITEHIAEHITEHPAEKIAVESAQNLAAKPDEQRAANSAVQSGAIPAKASAAPHPVQAARALLKKLQQDFPSFRDCLPLAIGIDKQLIAQQPDLPRKLLRIALGQHTNSLRYLKSLEKATHRFSLDGQPSEALTDEHRKHAATSLRERFKKEADQRRAQRAAEEAAHAAAEAARLHAEKLNQLAAKFAK